MKYLVEGCLGFFVPHHLKTVAIDSEPSVLNLSFAVAIVKRTLVGTGMRENVQTKSITRRLFLYVYIL